MGIKLVIVDDAPFIREAIRGILRNTEIEILAEATDGVEAVSLAKKYSPDVIIMDMVLPKKNGIDATREILEHNSKIKVIACSTEGQEELLLRALDAGCVNFISKPFKAEDLLRAVRNAGGK